MLLEGIDRDINIKDLSIEAPKKQPRSRLDQILDVTQDQWIEILTAQRSLETGDLNMTVALSYLYPDRVGQIYKETDDFWEYSKSRLDKLFRTFRRPLGPGLQCLNLLANLRLLFPEKADQLTIDQRDWIAMPRKLGISGFGAPSSAHFLNCAPKMKIIDSENLPWNLSDPKGELLRDFLPKLSDRSYLKYLALYRIAFQDDFQTSNLDQFNIEAGYFRLGILKKADWVAFSALAFDLKVVTAEEVVTSTNHLEIKDKVLTNFNDQVPLPKRRLF